MTTESNQPKVTKINLLVRTSALLESTKIPLDLHNAKKILQSVYPQLRSQLRNQVAGDDSMENYRTYLGVMHFSSTSNLQQEEMSCVLCGGGIVHREVEGRQPLTEEDHLPGPIQVQRMFLTCESGHQLTFRFRLGKVDEVTVFASVDAPPTT